MKLPAIQEGQVQSLGRTDIYTPIRTAQATARMASTIAGVTREIAGNYLDNKRMAEDQGSRTEFHAKGLEWDAGNADKTEYTTSEVGEIEGVRTMSIRALPDGTTIEETRNDIPAYEVQPELKKKYLIAARDASAQKISNKLDRDKFIRDADEYIEQVYGNMQTQATLQQKKVINDKQWNVWQEQIQKGDWAGAYMSAKTYMGTEDERADMKVQTDRAQETSGYDTTLNIGTLEELEAGLDILTTQPEDYYGRLDEKERLAYADAFRRRIHNLKASDRAAKEQADKFLIDEAKTISKALRSNKGNNLDPIRTVNVLNAVKDIDPLVAMRLEHDMMYGDVFSRMANTNTAGREYILNRFNRAEQKAMKEGRGVNAYQALITADLNEAHAEIERGLENNVYDQARKMGLPTPPPFNWGNVAESFKISKQFEEMYRNKLDASTGYNSSAEIADLQKKLPEMDIDQKLGFIKQAQEGLGLEGLKTFAESLDGKGIDSSFILAGLAIANEDPSSAYIMLKGAEISKDPAYKSNRSEVQAEIKAAMAENGGLAFKSITGKAGLVYEGMLYSHYYYAEQKGNFEGEIESSDAQKYLNHAAGPIIQYQGSDLQPFTRDMDSFGFEKIVNSMSGDYIEMLGDPMGYSGKQVITNIRNGKFQLVNIDNNKYTVYNELGDPILDKSRNNEPFVFRHEPELLKATNIDALRNELKFNKLKDKDYTPPPIEEQQVIDDVLTSLKEGVEIHPKTVKSRIKKRKFDTTISEMSKPKMPADVEM